MNRFIAALALLSPAPAALAAPAAPLPPASAAIALPTELEPLLAATPSPENAKKLAAHLADPAHRAHPNAAYAYALCHHYGIGVPADGAEALRLARIAGEQGSPEARIFASRLMERPAESRPQTAVTPLATWPGMLMWRHDMLDPAKTTPIRLRLARHAAALGNAEAARLRQTRDLKYGDTTQKAAAARALKQAAEAGDIEATLACAENNATDPDTPKLLRQAAEKGSALACRWLAQRNWQTRASWYKRGMELGDPYCANEWAKTVVDGDLAPEEAAKAFALLRLAVCNGDTYAQSALAECHIRGLGTPKDVAAGIALLESLAAPDAPNGSHHAAQLASRHERGDGVPKDPAKAFQWYTIAAENPNTWSSWNTEELARCHAEGIGVAKNPAEAERVLREAAEDHPDYWKDLAQHYTTGRIIPADRAKADACLRRAVETGGDVLGMLLLAGRLESEPNPTPAARAEADALRRRADLKARPHEFRFLAFRFEHGNEIPADRLEAAYWHARAATVGDDSARESAESLQKLRPKLSLVQLHALNRRLASASRVPPRQGGQQR